MILAFSIVIMTVELLIKIDVVRRVASRGRTSRCAEAHRVAYRYGR
jgi:hypothetical protein